MPIKLAKVCAFNKILWDKTLSEKKNSPRLGVVNFERRKHPRFVINLPVEYLKLDQSRNRPGRTGDLSEGGLLLYISDEMDIGQDLKITVFIDSGAGLKPIEVKARVVWKDYQLGNDEFRRGGVNFLEITPEHRETLSAFLNNLLKMRSLEAQILDRFRSS
jgi:c-di-GMP-binding flagellar brake protein YcgR